MLPNTYLLMFMEPQDRYYQQQQHNKGGRRSNRTVAVIEKLLPHDATNHASVRPDKQFREHEHNH
ncbi:hypothetical protein AIZ10_23225, partial [Salmonella enterica subsp. enterica serovar Typhimurium]